MKQDYIMYKGKIYNSGDEIDIWSYPKGSRYAHYRTGIFIDCDEEKDEYRYMVDGSVRCVNKLCFYRTMCDNPPSKDGSQCSRKEPKKLTMEQELNIDGMLIAWMWYIFIMAVGTICNGNIIIWIITSMIFFNYRTKKLKEAGYR